MENEEIEYFSKNEVIEILGIAEPTFYTLVQKGEIEAELLPGNIKRKKGYSKASVLRYQQLYQPKIPGLKVAEFATKHNLTNQRVYSQIKKLNLILNTIQVGKRNVLYLNNEQQTLLINEINKHKHRGAKNDFFNFKLDIALYQRFLDPMNGTYRVVKENGNWGFFSTNGFISFNEAVKTLQLSPAYSIHKDSIYIANYTEFHMPTSSHAAYYFLDLFYSTLGIENMHVYLNELNSTIELAIKSCNIKIPTENHSQDELLSLLPELNTYCLNGSVKIEDDELKLSVNSKSVTLELPQSSYTKLVEIAKINDNSISREAAELLIASILSAKI